VELDADDMEFVGGKTWVQSTFLVRYEVVKYRDCGEDKYDVGVLDAELWSAKAWFGDASVPVPCGDLLFCLEAEAMFNDWLARVGRDRVEKLCLADWRKDGE
jgi:hypothetical protein